MVEIGRQQADADFAAIQAVSSQLSLADNLRCMLGQRKCPIQPDLITRLSEEAEQSIGPAGGTAAQIASGTWGLIHCPRRRFRQRKIARILQKVEGEHP